MIRRSLGEDIADEARYLQRFDRARTAFANVFEGRRLPSSLPPPTRGQASAGT